MNKKLIYSGIASAVVIAGGGGAFAASLSSSSAPTLPKAKTHVTSVIKPTTTTAHKTAQSVSATIPQGTVQPSSTPPVAITKTSGSGNVRAVVDPTFTQNATNPLIVTFAYSASITDGTLPTGTLSLTVSVPGQVSVAGGCTMNVGGSVYGGNCTVTLPYFGVWQVTTTYAGATAGSTSTETVTVPGVNPTVPPTTAPSNPVGGVLDPTTTAAPTTTVAPTTTAAPTTTVAPTTTIPTPDLSWGNWAVAGVGDGSGVITDTIPAGAQVNINAIALLNGSQVPGMLSMTFSPTSVKTENGQTYTSDCTDIQNGLGEASGECLVWFNTPGSYTITLTYLPGSGYGTTVTEQVVSVD